MTGISTESSATRTFINGSNTSLNPGKIRQVDSHKKIGKKSDPSPRRPVATLTKQSMAYITVKGIESETSYLERDWPLFVLKELADNAFDFLNDCYPNSKRKIAIHAWIDSIPNVDSKVMLRMTVRNSNVDNIPIFENVEDVFDFNQWCSTKRYQYRETCGSIGDGLKRILGMGYASWTSNDNLELSYEYNQWHEPLILRFNKMEYKAFILVDDDKIEVHLKGPTTFDAPDFTEVQIALPVTTKLLGETPTTYWLNKLEKYYKIYKLAKRQIEFSFVGSKKEMD
jgi:hypothetical protein